MGFISGRNGLGHRASISYQNENVVTPTCERFVICNEDNVRLVGASNNMSFLQHLFLQVRRTLTLSVKSLEDKSSKSRDVYNLTMVVNGLQTTAQFIFLCVSPLIDII
ncbi:uncharacterized protein [Rutidosis leptorrhynchoides]|uniref:uncharacterized protein isoform X1 n=1 Tax=Rutidosis leptorrhynchoides TaxID=125765 RepID=UPI003A9A3110